MYHDDVKPDDENAKNLEQEVFEKNSAVVEESQLQDGKHLVKKRRRERLVRKGRMKQERFRGFVHFIITVALLLGLGYGLKHKGWYMNPNAFNRVSDNSVEIINNNIVPSNKILILLKNNKVPNVPLYMAKTDTLKKEILKLTPIEDVYIRRYAFPARIQIIVKERKPIITISPDEKVQPVAFFTSDGQIVGKEYLPLKKNYKTIKVLSYGNKGDDYHKWNVEKLNNIQKITKYIETYAKEPVEYIDLRNPNDIYVKIKTVNIRLGKIDATVYKRIERIPSILPQVKLVDSKVKYLDLSWEKVNYLKLK